MSVGQQVDVCGGVDTHRDVHMAAVVDSTGRVLGTSPFRADAAGYQQLGDWLGSHGRVVRVGIEGTGSYGAGLARYLTEAGVQVVEVNRPNRQLRRRLGKTDATDAQGAARALLNGQATAVPKSGNGRVEAIRMLSVACPFSDQSPHPGHKPAARSGSNRPRPGQTPARETFGQSPRQGLRRFPSPNSHHYRHLRQKDAAFPGPPISGAHRRNHRTRHRHQPSLRPGQPGAVSRLRSRRRHSRSVIGHRR